MLSAIKGLRALRQIRADGGKVWDDVTGRGMIKKMEAPCSSCPARRGLAADHAVGKAQWPARDQEGGNLWLTKPAERQPLLKSVGWRSAPAGTEPTFMSRSSIPAKPRVKTKASAHACASFRGSYWKGRGPGGGAPSRRNRIAGPLPAAIEGLELRCGFQNGNQAMER
jgi:hypothetical protein